MTKNCKPTAHMTTRSTRQTLLTKREGGFTLIEVMVALAILAVVAVAASRASSAYLSSVEVLRTRTLAHFVAQNVAADLRIQESWLTANSTQTMDAQGRAWQVAMTVNSTLSPALKEVNISVAPIVDGQVRSAVTDIDVILGNTEQDVGSLDLSSLNPSGGNL
ncbi:type II secretion system minor pseudopilin GspI [Psychrobacter sp. 1U1]|uniref:type II secretion system minor pseudopilin GspI n=1 Tax=Psychrobacter sp. 1U1 TaxID=3453576 RepID=UPI003F44D44E